MNLSGFVNSTAGVQSFTINSGTVIGETSTIIEDVSYPSVSQWATEVTVIQRVTESFLEQVITAILHIFFWVYVNATNGFLLDVIRKDGSLHTPQYIVLASYMVGDTVYFNFMSLHIVLLVITNNIHVMSAAVSRLLITISSSLTMSSYHMVGFVAFERLSYFVTPLKYPTTFTKTRICTYVVIIYLLSLSIAIAMMLAMGSSVLNPIVYILVLVELREAAWK